MSTKRFFILIILLTGLNNEFALAQMEIGASYELRNEDPQNGFGVRIEKGFLNFVPIVDIGMRAHFSFFSDENRVEAAGLSYSEDLTNYDFGIALITGIGVGLIEPYVGVGLGSTTIDIKPKDSDSVSLALKDDLEVNESNIYWNMLIGSKVTIIPLLKPFVEYRYSNTSLSNPENVENITGRIIFGLSLSF